jgi:hypothetical protein
VSVEAGGLTKVDGDTHLLLPDLLRILGAGCHAFLVGSPSRSTARSLLRLGIDDRGGAAIGNTGFVAMLDRSPLTSAGA